MIADPLFAVRDRVVVVTGGGGKLGGQFARALLARGARVAVFDAADAAMVRDPVPSPERAPSPRPSRGSELDMATVYNVPVGNRPAQGPSDALVTVAEFSDFQCPFCARAQSTLAQLRQQYGNRVRVVWLNMPLDFHANARVAAEAAMEAMAGASCMREF